MSHVRRLVLTVLVLVLLAATGAGVGYALDVGGVRGADAAAPVAEAEAGRGTAPGPQAAPEPPATRTPRPSATPEPEPAPEPAPELEPQGGPPLMSPGDRGPDVRELQARLRQIEWFAADVTGFYGDVTTEAVEGFQAKREIPVTGSVDRETLDRLLAMTGEPTADELANRVAPSATNTPGALDPRCTTGRVLCADKTSRTLRWVVDGEVRTTLDVRFGIETMPTREGTFSVQWKSRDHVSSLYGSSMPFAMFFSGGQAVHYSAEFAAEGYAGGSHGCVNVRDHDGIAALFDQVLVGDAVVVYRS
jgi:peptidoglycan hydrolase-like protein with peptidoglycan-binding domain